MKALISTIIVIAILGNEAYLSYTRNGIDSIAQASSSLFFTMMFIGEGMKRVIKVIKTDTTINNIL